MADVVCLEAFRSRRLAEVASSAQLPIKPTYLAAEPGKVLLAFSDGCQLDLAPEHARIWAERLLAMADVADALAKDGGDRG